MTEQDFIVDVVNTDRDLFDDPEASAAACRIRQTMERLIEAGDKAKPLTLTQKIFMTQDAVMVAEATLDYYQSDHEMRNFLASFVGDEAVWKVIAHWKTVLAKGRIELFQLKQQLGN